MIQFSSNEETVLEKQINLTSEIQQTNENDINYKYEIERCAEWIRSNDYKKVCLQFPDYLLPDSSEIALRFQSILNQTLYILGDTAYESCCVDYVAAAHVNADAIIHFGPVCFSQSSDNLPCLKIYEKEHINVQHFITLLIDFASNSTNKIIVLLDTPYIHYKDNLNEECKTQSNIEFLPVDSKELTITDNTVIYVGFSDRKLVNLKFLFNFNNLYCYNPKILDASITNYEHDTKILKRRNYLSEKIKDSNIIGIVIGTVAVKNYLKAIDRMKTLIQAHGKKYYVISVGKPTVAKLANFPEIDVYVVLSCAMNEIYESRDFYKPVVTPYDVELALNPDSSLKSFSYDYNSYLPSAELQNEELERIKVKAKIEDVSLITGQVRQMAEGDSTEDNTNTGSELAVRNDGIVANTVNGAGFLASRSWQGLEQNLGETNVELAMEGRRGIAQCYENEEGT